MGDTTQSLFLVPRPTAGILWGVGPTVLLPTATARDLGAGHFAIGVTAAVLTRPRPFTLGLVAGPIWSIAGPSNRPDIRLLGIVPVASIDLSRGWYVKTQPVVTFNWTVPANNRWTVPVGAEGGKVIRVGDVPMDVSVGAYWNVIRPESAASPSGSAQLQVAMLFP
jgi:hypothetical protein